MRINYTTEYLEYSDSKYIKHTWLLLQEARGISTKQNGNKPFCLLMGVGVSKKGRVFLRDLFVLWGCKNEMFS